MFLSQTIIMCFKNILSNKLRSFLSMLGIIIGISSVIVLVGFTQGTTEDINSSLKNLGANVLTINIYNDDDSSLTYDDIKNNEFNFVEEVVMLNQSRSFTRKGSNSGMYSVAGTTKNFLEVSKFNLSDGRGFADLDIDKSSNVVILGSDVATDLFENNSSIGEKILIGSTYYTVIGVLESESTFDTDYDSSMIIPISSYSTLMDDKNISTMYFVANEENFNEKMIERQIDRTLSTYISTSNYEIVTKDTVSDTVDEVDSITSLLIFLIGCISLIVSGVGVMNIMIVSVSERTREIGVRKAIGATDSDILKQFLIEAIMITTFGGIIGVCLGYLIKVISNILGITFVIDISTILISLSFSII
ncbi:MAG: ABC transporter permease, partial [Romboutsia sp.]|nr:ABC transporter permease [Romboutsia sp.]